MEPVGLLMDKIKGFAKAGEGLVKAGFLKSSDSSTQNPVEMLKRLQREAFSDLGKLRDRQEKVEGMLSVYKFTKGFPFLEAKTQVKGFIDVVGIMLPAGDDFQQAGGALDRAGIRTGIDSKIAVETVVRQKDALIAEIGTSQKCWVRDGGRSEIPLTLSALMYVANINDWLSVISVPVGARCSNFGIGSNILREHRRAGISSFGPSLFGQCHSCAAGLVVKGSNVQACLAELVSGQGMQNSADGNRSCWSTFAQVAYQPLEEIKMTLSGLWQMPRSPSQLIKLGPVAIPLGSLKQQAGSDVQMQAPPNATRRNTVQSISSGSMALMLDSEFDESTRLGGWIEVQKSSHNFFQWGISLSDTPDDELGYGLRVGGIVKGHLNQFQMEGFLNYNLSRNLNLQPGLVYVMEGMTTSPALVFRSSWSM